VSQAVFVTGATGYLGGRLAARLLERGHRVHALARPGSEGRIPVGCVPVVGDALDGASYAAAVPRGAAFVHLVGVAHPAPWKAAEFERVDGGSLRAALAAAREAAVSHFVYVSVAQPAPVMRAYQAVRARCEEAIRASGLPATLLRPWYILGPGHRWPAILLPFYAVAERLPFSREAALRLGFVRLPQMIAALAWAVEHPADGVRVLDVPAIREIGR
jgi:uncharacterized protein YbjT (DUF2867 family)